MREIRLEDAFTPVPPMVHARVEQSLQEVRAMNMKHKKPMLALALALILTLALACAAVAATQGGVLDYLFGSRQEEPTARQQQMVQAIGQSWQAGDTFITATDALFDGRKLDVGLNCTVARDTYMMLAGAWFNGEEVADEAAGETDGWVQAQEEPVARGVSIIGDERMSGPVEVQLQLMLLTPNKGLKEIDFRQMDEAACEAAFYAAVTEGYTPVDSLDGRVYLPEKARPSSQAQAWEEEANMTAQEVSLIFTVEADAQADEVTRLYYRAVEDEPWDVVVETAELTATSSHFVLDIYPKAGGMDWAQVQEFFLKHPYGFYDGNREKVAFQQAGSHYGQGDPCETPDGRPYWHIDQEKPAAIGDVQMLYLVPETMAGEALWEYAIRLEAIPAEALNG